MNNEWLDGWMNGWMDGWIDEWLDGWMDEWLDDKRQSGVDNLLVRSGFGSVDFLQTGQRSKEHGSSSSTLVPWPNLGQFEDTNYIIFRNVEIFFKSVLPNQKIN